MMIDSRWTQVIMLGLASVAILAGCAKARPFDDLWVDRRPYLADVPAVRPSPEVMRGERLEIQSPPTHNPDGMITLRDAVALALRQSPELRASGWSVAAAEADAMQLARPRNPTASLSVENFAGPDDSPMFQSQTLRISQVIELAGKREKRQLIGQADQRLRAWDYEQQRLEIAGMTASRYVAVFVAQQRVVLAEKQLDIAQSAYSIADDRATNGTRPGFERDQANTRVALSRIQRDQAIHALAADRADLAASWGADEATFKVVKGDLAARIDMPTIDSLRDRIAQSPRIARWGDEILRQERAIELQRANGVTDPTLGGGVRYFSDADETAGVAELSWPLPLLDDNEHGILAARLRLSQAKSQRDAAYAEANRQLSRTYSRAQAASETLKALDEQAIPAAQAAYDAALQSYQAGQADYLIALDAERTLLDLHNRQLDAALDYHTAIIALEQLTASPLGH